MEQSRFIGVFCLIWKWDGGFCTWRTGRPWSFSLFENRLGVIARWLKPTKPTTDQTIKQTYHGRVDLLKKPPSSVYPSHQLLELLVDQPTTLAATTFERNGTVDLIIVNQTDVPNEAINICRPSITDEAFYLLQPTKPTDPSLTTTNANDLCNRCRSKSSVRCPQEPIFLHIDQNAHRSHINRPNISWANLSTINRHLVEATLH